MDMEKDACVNTDNLTEEMIKWIMYAYRDENEKLLSIWHNMDVKANFTSSISGIFITGIFVFTNKDLISQGIFNLLIFISSFVFSVSIVFCMISISIRKINYPSSIKLDTAKDNLIEYLINEEKNLTSEVLTLFYSMSLKAWKQHIEEIRKGIECKAENIRTAQIFSGIGICVLFIMILHIIFIF